MPRLRSHCTTGYQRAYAGYICDLVNQRLTFLLPYDLAKRHVPNLQLAKAHWTRKKEKESGRPLGDLSFVDGCPLNTPETALLAGQYYGQIAHPGSHGFFYPSSAWPCHVFGPRGHFLVILRELRRVWPVVPARQRVVLVFVGHSRHWWNTSNIGRQKVACHAVQLGTLCLHTFHVIILPDP